MTDLKEDVKEGNFILMIINKSNYYLRIGDTIKQASDKHDKTCLVCLNRSYEEMKFELTELGVDIEKFYFVDVLGTKTKESRKDKNVKFIKEPSSLNQLKRAITTGIKRKKCDLLFFDTISALAIFQKPDSILHLTHELKESKKYSNTVKIYVIKRDEEEWEGIGNALVDDLRMFMDKIVDLTS